MISSRRGKEASAVEKECVCQSAGYHMKGVRILLITLGSVSLLFGMIGIFLPFLPTTPFLLLSSFCFMRSSPRFHSWLINHRLFGEYIYLYTKHKAIRKRTRIAALACLWGTIAFSALITEKLHVRLIVLAVGAAVSIHLIKLKTVDEEELLEEREKGCSFRK